MSRTPQYRTSLRIDSGIYARIERIRERDGHKVPLSAWLERAISEKLARDEVREDVPKYAISTKSAAPKFKFYEFFAGGGMARAGLGKQWDCLLANDFDPMKANAYRDNWGGRELVVGDISSLDVKDLPIPSDLAWASFPCQDLSLAGNYKGIGTSSDSEKTRSGTFWPFVNLMKRLQDKKSHPSVIVLENVYGILTANNGNDFQAICEAISDLGYQYGAMVIDGRHFVPQSRPRVFIICVRTDVVIPEYLIGDGPMQPWHPERLITSFNALSKKLKSSWIWWNLPQPEPRQFDFIDLIEEKPLDVSWHSAAETKKLISMMSDVHLEKLKGAQNSGTKMVGAVYKRTRLDANGNKIQRAEIRFDSIAGCLRTPSGGSSRQIIFIVEKNQIRSRLLSAREAARLMGLPDEYKLPRNYNDAYHVAGDGIVVPAVRHISKNIIERIIERNSK